MPSKQKHNGFQWTTRSRRFLMRYTDSRVVKDVCTLKPCSCVQKAYRQKRCCFSCIPLHPLTCCPYRVVWSQKDCMFSVHAIATCAMTLHLFLRKYFSISALG